MADSFIRVPVDGLGKLVDTSQLTVNSQTVQRERMIIGDNTDNYYVVVSATGGALVDQGVAAAIGDPWPVQLSNGTDPLGTATVPIRVDPTGTTAQPVTGTITAVTAITNALPAGTNVIGHVIADTGSTTAVTGNVTAIQGTGTNLHVVLDTTSTTAVTQATGTNLHVVLDTTSTTAVTQATGTNLHMVVDSGVITTVSTVTAVTAITNALPSGTNVIGHVITDATSVTTATLGTETTKVIGTVRTADGAGNLLTAGDVNNAAAEAGVLDVAPIGRYNATQPMITDTRYNQFQITARGELLVGVGTSGFTVTSNAGTNLNTSLLAIETGGNLAAAATSLAIMDDWDESDRAKVNIISGQVGIAAGTGVDGATVPRVTLATNVALPAGTNIIGHVIADTGSTTAVTGTVTMAGNLTHNNTVPAATNIGVLSGLANVVAPSYLEGDQVLLSTDLAGALRVTGGSTQYAEDTTHTSGDLLNMAGVVQQTADAAFSGDGDRSVLQVDSTGYLKVNVKASAAGGGASAVDDAAFVIGTGSGTPAMGLYGDATNDTVNAGDVGVLRMSANRNLYATLRDGGGNEWGAAVDSTLGQVVSPSSFFMEILYKSYLEQRATRLALVALVTEGGSFTEKDFDPALIDQFDRIDITVI